MIVLGVHCGHNSSAALMIDGSIVGAVQEERFTKRKNQMAFPLRSIRHLVDVHLDGDAGRIGKTVFASRELDPVGFAISRYSDFSVADHVREMHEYWRGVFYEGRPSDGAYWIDLYRKGQNLNHDHNVDVERLLAMPHAQAVREFSDVSRQQTMREALGWTGPGEIRDHHTGHAYYAFYGAQIPRDAWKDVLVLTADSWGDDKNWSAWTVEPDGTLAARGGGADHGVARIYRFVTLILGMKPNEHEYKVMGLSGYSRNATHYAATERLFFEMLDFRDGKFVREKPLKDSYFDLRDRLEGHRFDNISAALQSWSTAVTKAWARHWLTETGCSHLCFSGGLSMNIKSNGDLTAIPELKKLSVPASGGDESLSIGACYAVQVREPKPPVALPHVYLGRERAGDAENDWREGIRRANASADDFAVRENVGVREVAKLLAADQVVARVSGPMEFGARSLGNRSILANPKNPDNLKRINDAIKNRDFWMPFTPSILAEWAERYLVIPKGIIAPYMTIGYETTPLAKRDIPAALHPGDFSARPQFVTRDTNAPYWELISAFAELTGVGAVLNTSLNLHGDPMNRSVADGARTLALSALDFLVMPGDRLLFKRSAQATLEKIIPVQATVLA